jgi:hypothetical protein
MAQIDWSVGAADSPPAPSMSHATRAHRTGVVRDVLSKLTRHKAPKPAPPAPPRRPLDEVVALQRANGSWDLTSDLADRIGVPVDAIRSKRSGLPMALASESAWATLLALAWLEAHASDQRDEWMRLARKAEAWLTLTVPAAALTAARTAARELIRP